MSYRRHHSIIVSSWDLPLVEKAHAQAVALGLTVTPIVSSPINVVGTFCVVPDGSNEGWAESDRGDQQRADFREWLDRQRYDDGSTALDWAEIQYGDDEGQTLIVNDSDGYKRHGTSG